MRWRLTLARRYFGATCVMLCKSRIKKTWDRNPTSELVCLDFPASIACRVRRIHSQPVAKNACCLQCLNGTQHVDAQTAANVASICISCVHHWCCPLSCWLEYLLPLLTITPGKAKKKKSTRRPWNSIPHQRHLEFDGMPCLQQNPSAAAWHPPSIASLGCHKLKACASPYSLLCVFVFSTPQKIEKVIFAIFFLRYTLCRGDCMITIRYILFILFYFLQHT